MRTPLLFIGDNSPRCHTSGIAPLGIVGDIEDPIEGTYSPEDHVGFQTVFHIPSWSVAFRQGLPIVKCC